jgi:hypothetical protein
MPPGTVKISLSKGRASATKNAMLRLVARVLIARQHGLCRAGVEGHYHSEPFGRRCSQREIVAAQRVGRRERLSSWPQIHPSTTNAGHIWFWSRRDFGRFESKAYFGVIGQNVELALEVASRGYVLEAGAATLADSAAELHANPATGMRCQSAGCASGNFHVPLRISVRGR